MIKVLSRVTGFIFLLITSITPVFGASSDSIPDARRLTGEPAAFGNYEVYYTAFNSTFITPEIASTYDLKRSSRHGIINIAIRNIKDSSSGKAVTGRVNGKLMNLLSQQTGLEFKEVREGDAIYYLAGFRFSNEEMLRFNVEVLPEGKGRAKTVKFEQKFYEEH